MSFLRLAGGSMPIPLRVTNWNVAFSAAAAILARDGSKLSDNPCQALTKHVAIRVLLHSERTIR